MRPDPAFYSDSDVARQSASKKVKVDGRSPFAKDRDRILYTSAFLRLAGKTQIVSAGEPGLYHNRLTHTLKVAQLGRRASERLRLLYADSTSTPLEPRRLLPPDPDLVEAACLAHDLGHPPFGHAGEQALKEAFDEPLKNRQPSLQEIQSSGFEGNAQTFRILTFLAIRRVSTTAPLGLDLTRATLDATLKYPVLRRKLTQKKWGAYLADHKALSFARAGAPDDATRCFEAQLMDWCDDVTYAVHDVIDCYRGGWVPLHLLFHSGRPKKEIAQPTGEAEAFLEWLSTRYQKGSRDAIHPELADLNTEERIECWKELEAFFLRIQRPFAPAQAIKAQISALGTSLFDHFMNDLRWADGEIPCRYGANLVFDPSPERASKKRIHCSLLQELPWYYVIHNRRLATQQHGQQKMIRTLFEYHTGEDAKLELLLPKDRSEELEFHSDPRRAASDHIASLTERDASALYGRLSGLQMGALTDAV